MKKCFDAGLIFVLVCGLSVSIDMQSMFVEFKKFFGSVHQNNTPKERKDALQVQLSGWASKKAHWLAQTETKRFFGALGFCSQGVQIIEKAETPRERADLLMFKGVGRDAQPVLSTLILSDDLSDEIAVAGVWTLCAFLPPDVAYEVLMQQTPLYNEPLIIAAVLMARAQTVAAFLRLFSTNTAVLTKFLQLRNRKNETLLELIDAMALDYCSHRKKGPCIKVVDLSPLMERYCWLRWKFDAITASLRALQKDMAHRAFLFKMVQKPQLIDVRINFK